MDLKRKDISRFWGHIDKTGNCWLWTKCKDKDGYGKFKICLGSKQNQKRLRAHRYAWLVTNGPIPPTMFILHKCDNPPCCNPSHLYVGNHQQNIEDRQRRNRQAKGERAGNHIHVEKRPRGEKHGRSKLTWEQVREIRMRRLESQARLAKEFDVSSGTIWFVLKGLHWKESV